MGNIPLVRRQIAGSPHLSVVIVLCVVLSLLTLVSLSGFSRSVHSSFLRDARALHAADIIIHSHYPFSSPLRKELSSLEHQGSVESALVYGFYSVVRTENGAASLLAELKAVEPGYPFYGKLELASGRSFREALTPGGVIVEQALLERLHLRSGDRLAVGNAVFTIRDIVLHEPDRPVNFFSLGPRLFLAADDLAALDLIGRGSRVDYRVLVKISKDNDLDKIAGRIRAASLRDQERVETYRTAESRVKRFFDNFLFFLNLIGIFTLLLSGIGIERALTAFLSEQERTIAVMKTLGAGSGFIIRNYLAVVALLGLAGTVLGVGASFLLERLLPVLFRGLLPANVELTISASAVAEGLTVGLVVVLLFTILPLLRLKEVKPRAIFGKEEGSGSGRLTRLLSGLVVLFFVVMVLWRIGEVKTGVYFVLGVGLLVAASLLCASLLLTVLRRFRPRSPALRQAFKGLFRPRNATLAVIVTLSAALSVILTIAIIENNLEDTYVRSYPPDAPNVFFIDIQPSQKDAFSRAIGMTATYHPLVRGTILAVNGEPLDREQERRKRGDNLAREFNLTYRNTLLEDERLIRGTGLFRDDWRETQVSVLDTVLDMRDLRINDVITFRIQGLPVEARISSVRTRTRSSLQPFFYFVFPEQALRDAPQTLFTALRIEKGRISALQNRIVEQFPNVSVIDATAAVAGFSKIMTRLSAIVSFFTLFSVTAGVLIIISSVFATRHSRIQESVYFTILGARSRFVLSVFAAEHLMIGLTSGFISLAIAETASWLICRTALDIPYRPFFAGSLIMVGAMTLLVIAVGLGASLPALRHKPAAFLREHTEE